MRDTNDHITTILESISDAFFALDHDWHMTYVNHKAEQLLQKTREELVGNNIWTEFPEMIDSTFYQKYYEALETQSSVHFEAFYAPLNTWFAVRAYPSKDELFVYFQNVNPHKQVEAERERLLQQSVSRIMLYAIGDSKLTKHLAIFAIISYTSL